MPIAKNLLADIRYAFRMLHLNPGFACVAVLSIALGIGANTAVFSLIDTLMLRTLPIAEPGGLVLLSDPASSGVGVGIQGGERSLFTYEEFEHLRDHNEVFSGMFASESNPARLNVRIDDGPPEEVRGKLVSGDYFSVLGIRPALGRAFSAAEETGPGADPVVVISYEYWSSRFGQTASVLGRTIEANRTALTIIGVAPAGFQGEIVGDSPALYIPMMMEPQLKPGRYWLRDDPKRAEKVMWLHTGGRLKAGVSLAEAQANVDVLFRQRLNSELEGVTDSRHRESILNQRIRLRSGARGASTLRDEFARPLMVLMAFVGLVLLIACANVASLLLARATARQKEIGIRMALGAGRLRLVRQLLTEGIVLSVIGGAAGVFVAYWAAQVLVRLASSGPVPIPLEVRPDARILAFTAALSILTGVLFGLAPALRGTKVDLNGTLKDNTRSVSPGAGRMNAGRALVVSQVAISLFLLIGAGLFLRTLLNLKRVDVGYGRDHLLLVRLDPLGAGYTGASRAAVYRRLLESFRSIPGVRGVTLSENGLFSGTESADMVSVEGYHSDQKEASASRFDQIGPDYFSTLGIPMLLGREIGSRDDEPSARVCVINEAFAKFYFSGRNPIGKRITDEFPDTRATFEIIGVAKDVRDHELRGEVQRRFYVPLFHPLGDLPTSAYYELRTSSDPESLIPAVRRKIQEVDEALPILSLQSLGRLVDRSMTQERMIAQVSGFFGTLALLLAAIGLYGLLVYSIARRTHEIGIRMALGAGRECILRSVMRETLVLLGVGMVIGIPAAFASVHLVRSALFGLATVDPLTLAASVAVLAVTAAAAGYLPARRASRVDPLVALRCE